MQLSNRHHPWSNYPSTYRATQVHQLADWIATGANGSVIGLRGSGKSDLMGYLCHRPEVLDRYLSTQALPVTLLPMDLNTLPDNTLAALFRVILRTFYEYRTRFDDTTAALINQLYRENRAAIDPFLSQSALRELFLHLQHAQHRVVFALDRFDLFCKMLTPEMGSALRGLRDGFKRTLSYIATMSVGLDYVPEPELLGDLQRLLDQNICYVGPMSYQDTMETIARRLELVETKPTATELEALWQLTGGYPALVMAVCRWWAAHQASPTIDAHQASQARQALPPITEWRSRLQQEERIRQRLADIWRGFTQEEQRVLAEVQKNALITKTQITIGHHYATILERLTIKGLSVHVDGQHQLFSQLFADYVANEGGVSRGRIWLDATTHTLYHGQETLDSLTPKERAILQFLVQQPRIQHTYTDIIVAAWSDEERYHGVTNDSLYQAIRGLRQKIEPHPSRPVHVVNWRGRPEGGYIFYPEGRPT